MSSTFNPIESDKKVEKVGLFKRSLPVVPNGKAFVYIGNGGEYLTLMPNDKPTHGEMRWGKYNVVYTIDLSTKVLEISREFESKDPLENFKLVIEYTLKVSDPYKVVQNNVSDVASIIEKQVTRKIERLTTLYTVDQLDDLQKDLTRLTTDDSIVESFESHGIELADFYIKASLSEVAINRLKQGREEQRRLEEQREREKLQIELQREKERMKQQYEKELDQQRQKEEEERSRRQREREQEDLKYERERQVLLHELEKQKQQQEEELKSFKLQKDQEQRMIKLEHTKKIIDSTEDKRQLELYLSENMGDIKDALNSLREKDKEDRREFWDMLVKIKELKIMDENYDFVEIFKKMAPSQGYYMNSTQATQIDSSEPRHLISNPKDFPEDEFDLDLDESFNIDQQKGQKS